MSKKQYTETRARHSQIAEIAKRGVEDAIQKASTSDPALLEGVRVLSLIKVYKKKPAGYSKVSLEVVKIMLMQGGLDRTQKSIADELASKYTSFAITPRIWQRQLPSYEWTAIQQRVRGDLGSRGDVRGCKTLSEVRKKLISIKQNEASSKEFKKKICITKKSVLVGDVSYRIETKVAGRYKYQVIRVDVGGKRQNLRVDALEALLTGK